MPKRYKPNQRIHGAKLHTISIMDRYRGPRDEVVAAMMLAAMLTTRGKTMCQNRSPVRSACQALIMEAMTVRT